MATQISSVEDPEYISFLFSSELKHDCFFLVGNENQITPERIGVVKAHSVVLRLELEDSELAEKNDVPVPDIYPDTFRILLRYVYGHDTTAALCFDEADNLLYVAEKYMMGALKKKLATRLMSLLSTENICSLLNNPACYRELELNSAITKILRYETDKVLSSPLFLGLNPDGFAKILEQDGLNVPEIELWRAMMKWAKHNADAQDGKTLRKQVSSLTKHIRICTLSSDQLCKEVVPTHVLTDRELPLVCLSIGQQEKQEILTEICNEITPRGLVQREQQRPTSMKKEFGLEFTKHQLYDITDLRDFNYTIVTKSCDIELLPLECLAWDPPNMTPEGATYNVTCTTTITRITDYQNNTSTETPVTVRFNKDVEYGKTFMIPLISGGHNVTLLPRSKYTFKMLFGGKTRRYCCDYISDYNNSHLHLTIQYDASYDNEAFYLPMKCLRYKAADG